eukprot:s2978_g7.t1
MSKLWFTSRFLWTYRVLGSQAGIEIDGLLSFADRVLRKAKGSEVLRVELEALQEATEQAKISELRASGEAAAERGDWQEADACWAAALQLISESQAAEWQSMLQNPGGAARAWASEVVGSAASQSKAHHPFAARKVSAPLQDRRHQPQPWSSTKTREDLESGNLDDDEDMQEEDQDGGKHKRQEESDDTQPASNKSWKGWMPSNAVSATKAKAIE